MDFSANSYLDVYQGHIDTFHHIQDQRPGAFHLMMSNIYAQARCASSFQFAIIPNILLYLSVVDVAAVSIADIDFNDMDE